MSKDPPSIDFEQSSPPVDPMLPVVTAGELWRAWGLFFLTLLSVYWVYGTQFGGGDPFSDPAVAIESAKFAIALMAILLAHEMGHYIVARRHGFALSLPFFIPFPAAFGTFGAIIRLRSLPRTRTGLLEMGAAGPIAGFVVSFIVLLLGLPGTVEAEQLRMVMEWSPELPSPPPFEPGWIERFFGLFMDMPGIGDFQMMIFANPPLMDWLGILMNGAPPSRYATLDPLALAGWAGCLLTAINLLPIGQLDGGHICNAIWPERAPRIGKIGVGCVLIAGVFWEGWVFWGLLLLVLRAWMSLPVPVSPGLSPRAIKTSVMTVIIFFACFMPVPVEMENIPVEQFELRTPDGTVIDPAEFRAWLEAGEEATTTSAGSSIEVREGIQ